MKRILIVITTQFVSFGGLTTVAMNYYRALTRQDDGALVMDFASTNEAAEGLVKELAAHGSRYFRLPPRVSGIRYMRELTELAKNYDVVHVHANSATASLELTAAKRAGVKKRIVHIHNTKSGHVVLHTLLKPVFDRSYTDAIACSELAGDWIFGKGNFTVLNNAIDTAKYSFSPENRQAIRARYGLGDRFVVGHVGKLNEQKNHTYLLDVFQAVLQRVPDAALLLVGDGDKRDELTAKAEALGISGSVIFAGMQSGVERYLSAFDCLAFPSLWEGLPLSVLEAQASGVRCVLSDKITQEVNITGKVIFLPLSENTDSWVSAVADCRHYDRAAESAENCRFMRDNHYDVYGNADTLKQIYLS